MNRSLLEPKRAQGARSLSRAQLSGRRSEGGADAIGKAVGAQRVAAEHRRLLLRRYPLRHRHAMAVSRPREGQASSFGVSVQRRPVQP